ncbi:unnamed protein product, partial [marine sediment metagenome]
PHDPKAAVGPAAAGMAAAGGLAEVLRGEGLMNAVRRAWRPGYLIQLRQEGVMPVRPDG